MKEFFRFLKFALISASAGLIEIGSFTLFNEVFHLQYWLSYLIALILCQLFFRTKPGTEQKKWFYIRNYRSPRPS